MIDSEARRPLSQVGRNVAGAMSVWRGRRRGHVGVPVRSTRVLAGLVLAAAAIVWTGLKVDAASVPWAKSLPGWFRAAAQVLTDRGESGWILIPSGALILVLLLSDWRAVGARLRLFWGQIAALAVLIFVSVAGAGILGNIIKTFVGRARPRVFSTQGWLAFDPFHITYVYQSFPSGHSTTFGALGMLAVIAWPRYWPLALGVTMLGASTRVMVGQHYPSDVVAGYLLGAFFTFALARFYARTGYGLHFDAGGHMRLRNAILGQQLGKPGGLREAVAGLVRALGAGIGFKPKAQS